MDCSVDARTDENIKHQGTLEKQCKLKTWSWKKYWFVLFNEQLCYYKEQDSSKTVGGRRLSSTELGEIDLSQAHAIKELKNLNHGFSFEISTRSRSYILSADKEETRTQWVNLLQQAMTTGMARRRTSSIRSIRSSCNSIDEVDDGYSQIQQVSRHSSGSHNNPAPPPTIPQHPNRPASTAITDSIREETEDDLYCDVQTAGNAAERAVLDSTPGMGSGDYTYAVEMRKKTWKFMKQKSVDMGEGEEGEDSYTEVGYDSVIEDDTRSQVISEPPKNDVVRKRQSAQQNSQAADADESRMPEYSTPIPKAQRKPKASSLSEKHTPNQHLDGDYVRIRDLNSNEKHPTAYKTRSLFNFPEIKPLAHPRMEYTDRSHFDDIRLFLSRNRGVNEVFRDPPGKDLGGNAIDVLTNFLSSIDTSPSQPKKEIVESTHL